MSTPATLDEYFAGREESWAIIAALQATLATIGPTQLRVTSIQVVFCRLRL